MDDQSQTWTYLGFQSGGDIYIVISITFKSCADTLITKSPEVNVNEWGLQRYYAMILIFVQFMEANSAISWKVYIALGAAIDQEIRLDIPLPITAGYLCGILEPLGGHTHCRGGGWMGNNRCHPYTTGDKYPDNLLCNIILCDILVLNDIQLFSFTRSTEVGWHQALVKLYHDE